MGEGLLDLTGRIVVVSGAGGGGIGTTVTELAARCGATVLAVSRSRDNLDQHVAPLADQGLALLDGAAPDRRRNLTEMRDVSEFLEREFPALIERWQEERRKQA